MIKKEIKTKFSKLCDSNKTMTSFGMIQTVVSSFFSHYYDKLIFNNNLNY